MQSKLKKNSIFFLFLITTAFSISLLVTKVDQYPFWDDESSVSWFAKNLNKYGTIIGYDGHNGFFYRNGALLNQRLEYNNPPLDIYYIAFIQKYFGEGDVIERGAFIFLAICFMFIFYIFLTQFLNDKIWALISFGVFTLSINFILFSKNCRYYTIELLLAMSLIWVNYLLAQYESKKYYIILLFLHFIFSILIYLGHYTQGLAWIATSIIFNFILSNKKIIYWIKENPIYLSFNLVTLIIIIYHIWTHKIWDRPDLSEDFSYFHKIFLLLVWLIHDLNRYLVSPIWLIVLSIYLALKKEFFFNKKSIIILKLVLVFLLVSIIISPQNTKMSGSFDMRYIYSVFPFISIFLAYFLAQLYSYSKLKGIIISILFIFTSLFFYIPTSTPVQIPIYNYLKEKNDRTYTSASFELLKYLDSLPSNLSICVYPTYFHTQILDYYSTKFFITNTLDKKSHLFRAKIIDSLDLSFARDTGQIPDVLVILGQNFPLEKDLHFDRYTWVDTIDVFSSFDVEIFRPELPWHSFESITNFDYKKDGLFIFRK